MNPKQTFRVVCCRLLLDPTDEEALAYVPVGLKFREKGDTFGKSALSRIFCQFGDVLPESTREQIYEEVTTYDGWLTGGTENHIAMRRTAGYLFGEAFPDATFYHGLTGRELAAECFRYMREYGNLLYSNSMIEFLSPIYHACHTATWLNVWEFAQNPDARLCAGAILDWMFADLAANSHHGIIIPPCARAKGLMTDSYQLSTVRSNTQWSGWLYWGAGNREETFEAVDGTDTWKKSPLSLHAVSSYVPDPIIRNLGAKRFTRSYSLRQSRANRERIDPPSVNEYGKATPIARNLPDSRYVTRSIYVSENYAIGAGARVADIDEPTVRHAHTFGIIWRDESPRNWLFFVHPYWYVNRDDRLMGKRLGVSDWSGTSPFLQMVHHENAAVLMLDVPEVDPYFERAVGSNPKWISDRPREPYRRLNAYVPETVTDSEIRNGGTYLRAGDVFIGMRAAGGELRWEDCDRAGYRRLVLEGPTTAVAVEVGDRDEYGSFEDFVDQVETTALETDELSQEKRLAYTSTRGHRLGIRHSGQRWRPDASVNGVDLDYETWPICESPYLSCRDGVMKVNDGQEGMEVDWSGDLPVYKRYSCDAT